MSSVLIIGSNGLLGSSLLKRFYESDFDVGTVNRKPSKKPAINFSEHIADINDLHSLDNVIKNYQYIINCTGQLTNPSGESLSQSTEGISNICSVIKKYNRKLIHISSVSVYGSSTFKEEESSLNPETVYGAFKSFSEFIVLNSNIDAAILRVSNLYGPNQEKGLLSYMVSSYLNGKTLLEFNNDGSLTRYFLHVDDLAEIIFLYLTKDIDFEIYNILGPDFYSIKQLQGIFKETLGFNFDVKYSNQPPLENVLKISDSKIRNKLNYKYSYDIKTFIGNLKK